MRTYLKAAVASAIAGLSVLAASLADSNSLTAQDFISAAIAALVALTAVYQTPNQP